MNEGEGVGIFLKKMRKAIEVLLGEEKKAWKVELWREKRETRRNI